MGGRQLSPSRVGLMTVSLACLACGVFGDGGRVAEVWETL